MFITDGKQGERAAQAQNTQTRRWLSGKGFQRPGEGGAAGYLHSWCTVLKLVGIKVKFRASSAFCFPPGLGSTCLYREFSPSGGLENNFRMCVSVHVCVLSRFRLFVTLWTVAHPASLTMGFPRQEYWSGLPFSSSEDLPDPGIERASPKLAGGFFTTEPPVKPMCIRPLSRFFREVGVQ